MTLSFSQRIKRRVCLWGGQYTHPDGYVEYDYEPKAGIHKDDPTEVKMEKLDRYGEKEAVRERFGQRVGGAALIGFAVYLFASHLGLENPWLAAGCAAYGAFLLSRQS